MVTTRRLEDRKVMNLNDVLHDEFMETGNLIVFDSFRDDDQYIFQVSQKIKFQISV